MTVCIAAICDDGKRVVAVADKMITYPPPVNIEFESVASKIEPMTSTCLFMASGNVSFASDISAKVRSQLGGNNTPSIDSLVDSFKVEYQNVRSDKIYDTIVSGTFGKDFEAFKARGGTLPQYLQTQAATYGQIILASNNFNLNLELIICGIDTKGAHVYNIYHPGASTSLDKLGYSSIGSGANHALIRLSLLGQNTKLGIKSALVNALEAKSISELAPGVGKRTSVAVIDGVNMTTKILGDSLLDEIAKIQAENKGKIEPSFAISGDLESKLKTELGIEVLS